MDEKTAKEVFYGSPEEFVFRFLNLQREQGLLELVAVQQAMVDLADKSNNSAKATTYAFLDHAWQGERDWTKEVRNVTQSMVRKMRARKLLTDKITEPWHIDVCYGAFFGSGDSAYLKPVVKLIESRSFRPPDLVMAAEWSLNSLRQQSLHVEAALMGAEA